MKTQLTLIAAAFILTPALIAQPAQPSRSTTELPLRELLKPDQSKMDFLIPLGRFTDPVPIQAIGNKSGIEAAERLVRDPVLPGVWAVLLENESSSEFNGGKPPHMVLLFSQRKWSEIRERCGKESYKSRFESGGEFGLPKVSEEVYWYGPVFVKVDSEGKVNSIGGWPSRLLSPTPDIGTNSTASTQTSKIIPSVSSSSPNAPQESSFGQPPREWPSFIGELTGSMEIRVKNPNDFKVRVGLRSDGRGKDFIVAANNTDSVRVANGRYEIYFQYSTDPEGLYQGDTFSLNNNGVEIQIVKVVNGNYGIRKLK